MKKRIIYLLIFCFISGSIILIGKYSYAGGKSGSAFNQSSSFDKSSFNDKGTQGQDKLLGPPDPPTDDGDPIDTPTDNNLISDSIILLLFLGGIFLVSRKLFNHKQIKI